MTQLSLFKEKPKKIIQKIEEPKEQQFRENYFIKEKLKDKKVIICIEYNYTSNWNSDILERKPVEHLNGWYEGDYNGCIGGCGSEGFSNDIGKKEVTIEEKKERMIKWLKDCLLDDGYSEENISIKELPFNKEEELKKWVDGYKQEIEREKVYVEKEINQYRDKLTRAIKIKNFDFDKMEKGVGLMETEKEETEIKEPEKEEETDEEESYW